MLAPPQATGSSPAFADSKRNAGGSPANNGRAARCTKNCPHLNFIDASKYFTNTMVMNYRDYITMEPNKRGGKPCVRGLRITVYEVLEYLASEMTEEEILADFPDLTREDLKACIAFAADRERRSMSVPLAA